MDLASAALEAHRAKEAERRSQRELATAQNKLKQHQAIQKVAAQFGLGPVPLDELFSYESGSPGPLTYWRWAYPVTERVSLICATDKLPNYGLQVKVVVTNVDPRDNQQAHRHQQVRTLADIGSYLEQLERARAQQRP